MMSTLKILRSFFHLPSTRSELVKFTKIARPFTTNHELIRIGGRGDGGYLVPNDLDGIKACFSPGVNTTADFEEKMAELGIPSFMADYSVDGSPINNPLFDFEKKFLGNKSDKIYMTLEDWVSRKAPKDGDLILQMDIEGGEYPTIEAAPLDVLKRFRIIVIEFHRLRRLRDQAWYYKILSTFEKLNKDFHIVHIHPNNYSRLGIYRGVKIPGVMEFTFLRKDRVSSYSPTASFPHYLDKANVMYKPDIVLPECWYKD